MEGNQLIFVINTGNNTFCLDLVPAHTNADSFESVYFLIRLGLLSTLTRGSDPPNPYKFGNAFESG